MYKVYNSINNLFCINKILLNTLIILKQKNVMDEILNLLINEVILFLKFLNKLF